MFKTYDRREARRRRHHRVRKRVAGSPERPRLAVYRSHNHIYAQVVDDVQGHTVVAASTVDPVLRGQLDGMARTEQASRVGRLVAERAREQGVQHVVFDRGGYLYHGRVKALAEAAREAGLEF